MKHRSLFLRMQARPIAGSDDDSLESLELRQRHRIPVEERQFLQHAKILNQLSYGGKCVITPQLPCVLSTSMAGTWHYYWAGILTEVASEWQIRNHCREIYDYTGYDITVPPPSHLERVAHLRAGFDPRVSRRSSIAAGLLRDMEAQAAHKSAVELHLQPSFDFSDDGTEGTPDRTR